MPPDRFVVDLTSVCVRRGAVQLPFRLKDAFSEGPVAAVDADGGDALELVFRGPRELGGLGPFFEAHGLRANDSVALVFSDEGLRIHAVRRERAGAGARPSASPGGPGEASGRASSPTAGDGSAPRSAASPTPPSLRLEVPTASEPAEETERPASPPRGASAPRWEPLDVTQPALPGHGADAAHGQARRNGASATVREVRRRAAVPAEGDERRSADASSRPEASGADPEPTIPSPSGPPPAHQEDPSDGRRSGLARRLGFRRGGGSGTPDEEPTPAEAAPQASGPTRGEAVAVEDTAGEPEVLLRDIGAVRAYLSGPDVPAIVRSERVAEALGMSVPRAERALDRVSEDAEHLSRIRHGAYMLRRPSQG